MSRSTFTFPKMKRSREVYFYGVKLVLMAHIIALRVFMFVQARYPPITAVFWL